VVPVAQRLHGGLDDMRRRFEIRLSDSEIDNVLAALGQLVGAGENLECRFSAQAGHGIDKLRHCFPSGYCVAALCPLACMMSPS
jgi:hypothetical protein